MIYASHPSIYLDHIAHEDSTSNLLRHVRTCEPPETPESETLAVFASGATYSKAKYRYLLALWCARRHRPFSIVEDPEFCRIVHMLYMHAETPSCISVLCDIQHLLRHARMCLIACLGVCSAVVVMSLVWMFMHGWDPGAPVQGPPLRGWLDISKLYVIPGGHGALGGGQRARACHARFYQVSCCAFFFGLLQQNANIVRCRLNKAHTGVYLAQKLVKSLEEYGIEKKVCLHFPHSSTFI